MSEFNGDQVVSHFNLSPEATIERAAMKYMYRMIKDESPPSSSEKHKEIGDITKEKIEFRFDLYKGLSEDFFFGKKFDKDALSLAVICDEYVTHINEPYFDQVHDDDGAEEDDEIPHRRDGFDDDLVLRANTIWEDSMIHGSGGVNDDSAPLSRESLFLAHINAIQDLHEHEQNLDEYDEDVLERIRNKEIPEMRAFADKDTEIGNHLLKFLAHIEQEISAYLPPEEPTPAPKPPRSHPHLTLVKGP